MREPDARDIVKTLGGRWHGRYGTCRCPAHDDREPSLSVTQLQDTVLVKCHAGCSQQAALLALRELGLWPDRDEAANPSYPQFSPRVDDPTDRLDEAKRVAAARHIWNAAQPVYGSPAELYLRHRGIRAALPPTLRCEPHLRHSASGRVLPALVGAIQDEHGRVIAVQRIYLRPDGMGKADLKPNKLTLAPMKAGAVRLGRAGRVLGLAEGIETALSAMQVFSLPVWACLGASRLGTVALPDEVEHVVIFADNGEAGLTAAEKAARLYEGQGRAVAIEPPEAGDWNDYLRSRDAA